MEKVTGAFGSIGKAFKGLTKREQVMIYGLVVIVVLAILIFLIILPAMTHISELSTEVADLQTQETEMRLTIAGADSAEKTYKESESSFKALKKQLYMPMDPESLDELVTSFLVDSGLTPKNLTMTTLQQAQMPAFNPPALQAAGAPTVGTDGALTEDESAGATEGSEGEGGSGIQAYVYTVDINAEGNNNDLAKLLDNAAKTTGIEITKYTYETSEDDLSTGITSEGTITATISVFVYVDSDTGGTLPAAETTD